MKNNAKSDYTIKSADKALRLISKHANLNNPEEVKRYIANKTTSNGHKKNLCWAYNKYCNYYKIEWEIPKYKTQAKSIRIPTKEQIEMIIASAGKTTSLKLTISKETGLRPIELHNLKVKDIDLERKTIYPTTAKHGLPRKLKISNSLQATLQNHINRKKLKPEDRVFRGRVEYYSTHFRLIRNRIATKLNKPELKTIRLYDLRHYFATTLYAKTRDILLVKQQMGHRKIDSTLIYTQLLDINEEEEYICKATTDTKQAQELIENGFTYTLTTPDEIMLFRKRK